MRISSLARRVALALLAAATWCTAHAAPCGNGYVNPVTRENCSTDPATWTSAWQADRQDLTYDTQKLAGYASRPSVNSGETIHFYVHAPLAAPDYSIDFYRLGWYGGAGGRLVAQVKGLTPVPQPACEWQDGGTVNGYLTCRSWRVSYSLTVPTDWVSGIYLAAIRARPKSSTRSSPTYAHEVVFVVRNDQRRADFIYQQAVATEQAYNDVSGPSLYDLQTIGHNTVPVAKVSFERPFDALDNLQLYRFELPFIDWLEKNGYDVVYSTDIDTHERRAPLASQYKALLTAGHSEYWSKAMYDNVQGARDQGLNLGFFSGNTLYTQMRLEDERTPAGDSSHNLLDRVMVVYRYPYPPNAQGLGDPNRDPAVQTIRWRDFPLMRDEEALVGVHFTRPMSCPEHVASWAGSGAPPQDGVRQTAPALRVDPQPLTVADAASWVYAGTGLQNGDVIPHVYGQETDAFERPVPAQNCGRNLADPPARPPAYRAGTFSVLSQGRFDAATVTAAGITLYPTRVPVNSVVYQACSGAWVFGAGDIMWANALGPSFILGKDYTSAYIQQVTGNVLDVFSGRKAAPPAGTDACVISFPAGLLSVLPAVLGDD